MRCVTKTPQIKKRKEKKEVSTGCVREISLIKMKPAQDVLQEKLPA